MSDNARIVAVFFIFIAFATLIVVIGHMNKEVSPATCNELCGLGRVESYRFNSESKHYECFCRKD